MTKVPITTPRRSTSDNDLLALAAAMPTTTPATSNAAVFASSHPKKNPLLTTTRTKNHPQQRRRCTSNTDLVSFAARSTTQNKVWTTRTTTNTIQQRRCTSDTDLVSFAATATASAGSLYCGLENNASRESMAGGRRHNTTTTRYRQRSISSSSNKSLSWNTSNRSTHSFGSGSGNGNGSGTEKEYDEGNKDTDDDEGHHAPPIPHRKRLSLSTITRSRSKERAASSSLLSNRSDAPPEAAASTVVPTPTNLYCGIENNISGKGMARSHTIRSHKNSSRIKMATAAANTGIDHPQQQQQQQQQQHPMRRWSLKNTTAIIDATSRTQQQQQTSEASSLKAKNDASSASLSSSSLPSVPPPLQETTWNPIGRFQILRRRKGKGGGMNNHHATTTVDNEAATKNKNNSNRNSYTRTLNAHEHAAAAFDTPGLQLHPRAQQQRPQLQRTTAGLSKAQSANQFLLHNCSSEELELESSEFIRTVTTLNNNNTTRNSYSSTHDPEHQAVVEEETASRQQAHYAVEEQKEQEPQSPVYDDKFLDVCHLDRERAKLLGKVTEPNNLKILSHWTGTILNEVIYDHVFWITLVLYTVMRLWIRFDYYSTTTHDNANSNMNNTDGASTTRSSRFGLDAIAKEAEVLESLPIVGGFLTLFLVFFVNQNHARYYSMHCDTMLVMGKICSLAALLASSGPYLPIERSRRINRYCNAAHVVMYAGLSEYLQEANLVHNLCRDYALLTEKEIVQLIPKGFYQGKAATCNELITWALMDVNHALGKITMIDAFQAQEMRVHLTDFRSTVAKIFVTCLCPIPFFYVHFLSLLTAIYLPLFALMVAFQTGGFGFNTNTVLSMNGLQNDSNNGDTIPWYVEAVGFLLVFLQSLFVVGLRLLGQQLGNPYGEDFIDLEITNYIMMVLSTSNRILEASDVDDITNGVNPDTEYLLKTKMVQLGTAWGTKRSSSMEQLQITSSSDQLKSNQRIINTMPIDAGGGLLQRSVLNSTRNSAIVKNDGGIEREIAASAPTVAHDGGYSYHDEHNWKTNPKNDDYRNKYQVDSNDIEQEGFMSTIELF